MRGKKRAIDPEDTFINNSDYDENSGQMSPQSGNESFHDAEDPIQDVLEPEGDLQNSPQNNQIEVDHTDQNQSDGVNDIPEPAPVPELQPQAPEPAQIIDLQPQTQETLPDLSQDRRPKSSSSQPSQRNEPRLVIDKLVLTNFKSYAGVQEIGPFSASFSAVVGPNGSGKSNVIDSMLFVFGFRASKMRQGKLSELIHNSDGQKLDFCQVDIHFVHVIDDPVVPAKSTVVPGSELVISRRALRSNGSQYYINGRNSTYTDVTAYLRGQGIDLDHKRFLILQGEVESIAQMKAKAEKENDDGLLEYLEDIIGTSKYKSLIESSLAQIEDLNQVCLEKENRFELVENDTKSLEEKKDEALKFLRMEKSLTDKRSIKFQVEIHENTQVLSRKQAKAKDILSRLEEESQKNKDLSDELEKAHQRKRDVQQAIEELNKAVAAINKKQKSINSQTVSLEEKNKNLQNKIKKIQKARANSETVLSSNSIKYENMKEADEKLKVELADLESSLHEEKRVLSQLRANLTEKTSHFSKEIQELQAKLEPYNDKLSQHENNIELIESEIAMLENQKQALGNKLKAASQRLVDIKAEGKTKESELASLEKKLDHISEQIVLGEEQCTNFRKHLEGKRVRLASARSKTQDAASNLANVQNKNKVLVGLSRLAKSGRIDGFYGRLGDLGEIDDKYDIAVSTACPALDSMVVGTVETAQTCIDYLRKNKLGYANFICLNKLRNFDTRPIKTPGNPMSVKRLFDLITPKDKMFLSAFYSKLRDTLVASNLQEAKSVAYGAKRFKVVTLDGKVVDTSGTMSGGGNSFARGGMKLRSNAISQESEYSEEDVNQMREELASMESTVEKLNVEYQEMESNLRKLKELKPETEFAIQTMQLDIQALVNEKKEVSETCKALMAEKEQSDKSSEADTAISSKKEALAGIVKARDDLKSQMLESETRIILLEEKIMEAGGVELKVQNSKVDSIKQHIEIIQEKTSGDVVTFRKLENDIKRHRKIVADSEAELESAEAESSTLEEELQARVQARNELHEQLEALNRQINDEESELEKVDGEVDEVSAKINEFKSEEIELRDQLEKLQSVIRRCERAIEESQEALQGTILRDAAPYIEWMKEEQRAEYDSSDVYQLSEEEIAKVDLEHVEQEIGEIEKYMNEVKVDIEVLKEYGLKQQELEVRRAELNDSVGRRDGLQNHCEELKRKRLDEFMEGFNTISLSLKEMYQMITMGGNAELELVDSLDPFSEGILFSVMPPKKSWKNISNLSGGEKTLSSLALVFALHKYKPTPLYVMDEIDAALDFRNVSIVANYIKERTKNAQFIVISLRNNMFELSQQLVGIYKVSNMTRSISLKNRELFVEDTPLPRPKTAEAF